MIELTAKNYVKDPFDEKYQSDEGFLFKVAKDNQSVILNKYNAANADEITELVIPNEVSINGKVYPVTEMSERSLGMCENLQKLTVLSNMKTIPYETFDTEWSFRFHKDNSIDSLNKLIIDGCRGLDVRLDVQVESVDFDSLETLLSVEHFDTKRELLLVTINGSELQGKLTLPQGTTIVKNSFFSYCKQLHSLTFPSGLKEIGIDSFLNGKNIKVIHLNKDLEIIRNGAFENTNIEELKLPNGIAVGSAAFRNCKKLVKVFFPQKTNALNLSNVLRENTITEKMFDNCHKLTEINLPENIETIEDKAFQCTGLKKISIPAGVKLIGADAFSHCRYLTDIELSDNIETIRSGAFQCTPIQEISIPAGVKMIEADAFSQCKYLNNIYCHIEDPSQCDVSNLGLLSYDTCTLHVPKIKGIITAYKKKSAWKQFKNIVSDL